VYPVRVGIVAVGIALPYVAVTLAVPAVASDAFLFNVTVYVFAVQVAVKVALPLVTPRFVLLHVTLVLALNVLLFTLHLLKVYPVVVIAAGVVNVPPYVQLAGLVGAVPCPPFAYDNVIVLPVAQFGLALLATPAVPVKVPLVFPPLL
jgi:hypothetical protein